MFDVFESVSCVFRNVLNLFEVFRMFFGNCSKCLEMFRKVSIVFAKFSNVWPDGPQDTAVNYLALTGIDGD